ncbi:MAG: hypothetical protein DPW16_03435 [Chloroflexi bacterium]|nr:hypothetical protein [Chloroflexota bacterium]
MEKIIFIACLKTSGIFFLALVILRLGIFDRRKAVIGNKYEYLLKSSFQRAFDSKNPKFYHKDLSVTLEDMKFKQPQWGLEHAIRKGLTLLLLTLVLFALSVFCWTIRDSFIIKEHEFYQWTPIQATIQDVETRQNNDLEMRKIYTYEVDGVSYDNRYSSIQEWGNVHLAGTQALASLQVEMIGQPLNIIYNPKNPQESIQQRELTNYHDVQLEPELRSRSRYGAYLTSIVAGAVVFPSALKLLFVQRGHGLDANV